MLRDARNLNLLWELSISQYKLKDQSSFFGFLWSFLNPILMVGILFVFFRGRFGADVHYYGVYLLLGMIHYTHYSNATVNSMRVFVSTRQLVKEAVFPKELLVFSATLSNSVDYVIAMGVSLVVAWASGIQPNTAWLALPIVLVLQMLLVSWVSLVLSCVFPFARDVDHIYQVFLRALMFLSPIFYTEDFVGEGVPRLLVVLNPLAQLMQVSRAIVIDGVLPDASTWIGLLAVHGVFVWLALRVFRAVEPRLAEYV